MVVASIPDVPTGFPFPHTVDIVRTESGEDVTVISALQCHLYRLRRMVQNEGGAWVPVGQDKLLCRWPDVYPATDYTGWLAGEGDEVRFTPRKGQRTEAYTILSLVDVGHRGQNCEMELQYRGLVRDS